MRKKGMLLLHHLPHCLPPAHGCNVLTELCVCGHVLTSLGNHADKLYLLWSYNGYATKVMLNTC